MPFLLALAFAALVGALVWYEIEYPCVRSMSVWISARTDLIPQADGNVMPIYHPGQWQLVCLERQQKAR
jgi:hypothetical protein